MVVSRTARSITFAVDDVVATTQTRAEVPLDKAWERLVAGPLLASAANASSVIDETGYHGLLAAVYVAFNEHRPLVLSPDAVWLTIAQGVAHHMIAHGESLRRRFVAHAGRLPLTVHVDRALDPDVWPPAFAGWTHQIRSHVGDDVYQTLVCDFSTTGPIELTASHIVMMDVFERYFHYIAVGICGIPTITLEGTIEDWRRLRDKAASLERFGLGWWTEHLIPTCDQFVRAADGDVDLPHWRSICKLREDYGGHKINGWVAKLFPYLRAFFNGPCTQRNPIFENGEGFTTLSAPSGLSDVSFDYVDLQSGQRRMFQAIAGFVGVAQDATTGALRSNVGWAVREAVLMDRLMARLARDHTVRPPVPVEPWTATGSDDSFSLQLPPDMARFYHETDGAELFGVGETARWRVVPTAELLHRDRWTVARAPERPRRTCAWVPFCALADGSWLIIDLASYDDERPIRHVRHLGTTTGPEVAPAFAEVLAAMLDSSGTYDWLAHGPSARIAQH